MILGYHHTGIATRDLDKMLAFYCDMLGFSIVADESWRSGSARHDALTRLAGSAARYVVLRLGHAYLELFEYHSPTPSPNDPARRVCDPGLTHIGVAVDDIDAEFARLSAAGVAFHCPPGPPAAMRATYGRDPEGNVFELIQFAHPAHPFAFEAVEHSPVPTPSQPAGAIT